MANGTPCEKAECVMTGPHPWHLTEEQLEGREELRFQIDRIREQHCDDEGLLTLEGQDEIYKVWSGGRAPTPRDEQEFFHAY